MPEPDLLQQQRQILKVHKTAASERNAREAAAVAGQKTDQETSDTLFTQMRQEAENQYANAAVGARLCRQSEQGSADTTLEQARSASDMHLATVRQAQEQTLTALATVGMRAEYQEAEVKPPDTKSTDVAANKLAARAVRTRDLAVAVLGLTNDLRIGREKGRNRRRNLEIAVVVGLIALLSFLLVAFNNWQRQQAIRHGHATATAEIIAAQATATAEIVVAQATATAEIVTAQPIATAMAPMLTRLEAETGMEMVYVPPGDFIMGSPEDQGDNDEHPQHTVRLGPYWIDKTEVTAAQYRQCVEVGECSTDGIYYPCTYLIEGASDHPINCVEWSQAEGYCRWASKRLPTEAEWEKAARGVDGRTYPWGEDKPDCGIAQFYGCDGRAVSVGSRPSGASPYGAMDMAGNIGEWVADWYGASYYFQSPGQNPLGPASGDRRVVRGGSWLESDGLIRVTNRQEIMPNTHASDTGFRCAISP